MMDVASHSARNETYAARIPHGVCLVSKHLLIAGTGRAGTSFLVRYLTGLGLETRLSRPGEAGAWYDGANAGLEDLLLPDPAGLPYVIKSPWTYQFIDELLAKPGVQLDAVILPMRDLTEAAASRCIIELQQMHDSMPRMNEYDRTWEDFGHTAGGIIFSTSPVDQARLLAVGFHHLLDRLVRADIPVILLSFPRFAKDPDYLYRKLAPALPPTITLEQGRAAHAGTADLRKVRVGAEIAASAPPGQGLALRGPGHEQLDRAALGRALRSTRQDLTDARSQLTNAETVSQSAREDHQAAIRDLEATRRALAEMMAERDSARATAARHLAAAEMAVREANTARDRHAAEMAMARAKTGDLEREQDQAREALEDARAIAAQLHGQLKAMRQSTTWRLALLLQKIARRAPWAAPWARRLARG
jgi:hypothetical protein